MRFKSRLALIAAMSVALIAPPGVANATELVEEYSITSGGEAYESTFTLEFAEPVTQREAKREVEDVLGNEGLQVTPPAAKTFKLKCSTPFGIIDARGRMSAQHKCGSSKAPWGFKIHSNIQKRITGKVKERGMDWSVNGKRMPRQAPHVVGKNYQFHGTWTLKDNQALQYSDKFTFPVGRNTGNIKIGGKLMFTK